MWYDKKDILDFVNINQSLGRFGLDLQVSIYWDWYDYAYLVNDHTQLHSIINPLHAFLPCVSGKQPGQLESCNKRGRILKMRMFNAYDYVVHNEVAILVTCWIAQKQLKQNVNAYWFW